jgi:hypothetical protein
MDKRGIAALRARAGFGVAHYATLRMTLDLAEKVENKGRDAHYSASNLQFIQRQYRTCSPTSPPGRRLILAPAPAGRGPMRAHGRDRGLHRMPP